MLLRKYDALLWYLLPLFDKRLINTIILHVLLYNMMDIL